MRITPARTSYPRDGASPSFRIETDRFRYFAVEVATHAFLLNGAATNRRTQENYFNSWLGDAAYPARRRQVVGQHLEAPTGRATYQLPEAVWRRLRNTSHLYYRLVVSTDTARRHQATTISDVDWARAPAVSISYLPARPLRSPVARFRGRGAMSRSNFAEAAQHQMGQRGIIKGRDGDFYFAVLDARHFHMTVLETHEWGLTDTVEEMPRKPDAIINGQFISGISGIDTEGQVIREGRLINTDSQSTRYYIAQTWRGSDVSDYHIGQGDPNSQEPNARAAFGGLGPVLLGGSAVSPLTPWAQSVYDRSANTGRGVIAIERDRGLILLLVQQDNALWSTNAMTMPDLRRWLLRQGFDDAVFNDGSDSESLYAGGGWLLTPGYAKDESMDFAIGFVDRRLNRRFHALAIDGTKTADGETFAHGIDRPLITHYSPRRTSQDLQGLPALSSIATTFDADIIKAWKAETQTKANVISRIIELAGFGGHWADILYVSSHAWRHGQLWYYRDDDHAKPKLMIANIWSRSFQPIWRTTPRWLIIAGCAVLGLRYSRGLRLDTIERGHLVDWHREMHGAGATVPGLTAAKQTLFAVYHPGWAWYARVLQTSGVRGVLGYWYRSPAGGIDVEIMEDFSELLREGKTILEAWEEANQRGWFEAAAAWAAMVRDGCESDTLATLENGLLPIVSGTFKYYDRFQNGRVLPEAYRHANRLTSSERVGRVIVRHNEDYDEFAIAELEGLAVSPTPANFLEYNDGIGP